MKNSYKNINKGEMTRSRLTEGQSSPIKTYMNLTIGDEGIVTFIAYELLNLFIVPLPGALGFYLRRKLYRFFMRKLGKGTIIGRNVTIRHPRKIVLGDNVTIDDNTLIDARGSGEKCLIFEDNVIINRNCIILAKFGHIHLGKNSSVGSNSVIVSTDGVSIGSSVLIAGGCYISAGSYHIDNISIPIVEQGSYTKGPVLVDDDVWLGTGAIILDGISIGKGAVVGAGAVVTKNVVEKNIVTGVPAKVLRIRS